LLGDYNTTDFELTVASFLVYL